MANPATDTAKLGTFVDRLRHARTCRGFSARALGRLAEIGERTVSTLEKRGGSARTATAEKLAAPLGVSVGWLMLGEGRAPKLPKARKKRAS